jgi:hypothetical protein
MDFAHAEGLEHGAEQNPHVLIVLDNKRIQRPQSG